VSLFASDVLDIYADRGHDDDDATFWQMKATADELATALDADRDPVSGCAWLDDARDIDAQDIANDFESWLGDIDYIVSWSDGYVIERIDDASDMTDDGDTVELFDGTTLRLRIEADQDYNGFDEADCYGRIGIDRADYYYGRARRPEGFDGNAEKVSTIGGPMWWQPPTDVKRTDEGFAALRSLVSDLASFGWHIITVEHCEGVDAYGRGIVRGVASLGGIDSVDDATVRDIVADLIDEATADASVAR